MLFNDAVMNVVPKQANFYSLDPNGPLAGNKFYTTAIVLKVNEFFCNRLYRVSARSSVTSQFVI